MSAVGGPYVAARFHDEFADAVPGPVRMLRVTEAEGAGTHCECTTARS